MIQVDFLVWITQLQNPFLNKLAAIFTFMGNETFYMIILPLIYWCYSKELGFRLLYIFGVSIYVNSLIKIKAAVSRPVGVQGIQSIFVESAEVGSHYPHDSFPSGHAQGSTSLWGYLAFRLQNPYFWALAIFFIIMISFSRIYSGLHWPTDVIAGILIAIITLIIAVKVERLVTKQPSYIKWILAIIFPILLAAIFPQDEGIKLSGFLFGAGIGYLLEGKFLNYKSPLGIWKKIMVFAIGLLGMFALKKGLPFLFPSLEIFDFLTYGLLSFWGLFLAPWLFIKLHLAKGGFVLNKGNKPPISM